jgi:DAK2 domain fusion protein YloV
MMAPEPAAHPPPHRDDLWAVGDAWLRRADEVIGASAEALNAMNVFPVADADTGSNLRLTLRGMVQAAPAFDPKNLDLLVQGAILSAHGNSGAIVAEMFTSVCRWLQQQSGQLPDIPAGVVVASLLRNVSEEATRAVARPVAGTILTVAAEAARTAAAAAAAEPADPLAVAQSAQRGAAAALSRTPEQLEVLGRAGVVDAGGQAFVLLVDCLVEVLGGPVAEPLLETATPNPDRTGPPRSGRPLEYEVMYALRGAGPESLDQLRSDLSDLGHSVVIVGDQSVAQVHVHLAEPGPAVEAALGRGELSQIRITALETPGPATSATRTVVSMVAGPGIGNAVRAMGGVPLLAAAPEQMLQRLEQVVAETCGDVILLPNDMENLEVAGHVAAAVKSHDRRVAVIPTVAQVQGLAAIAVHEPTADFDGAVVTMSTAAGHARGGAVTVAESPAMTMAGRCEVGDVLGIVEGDFVEIGDSVLDVAWRVVGRLLASGGELLTLVAGAGCDASVVEELEKRTRSSSPAVDVERIDGGQQRYLLLVGLE